MIAKTTIKFRGELGTNLDGIDEKRLMSLLLDLETSFNSAHLYDVPQCYRMHIFLDASKGKKKNETKKRTRK
jgi:hypothetical protein